MVKKQHYTKKIINDFYHKMPYFEDVFDEESWYLFVICLVIVTFIVVYILSRFITLEPVDW